MIQFDNSEIIRQHQDFIRALSKGAGAPLFGVDFLKSAFPTLCKEAEEKKLAKLRKRDPSVTSIYPYEVRIPKSLQECTCDED